MAVLLAGFTQSLPFRCRQPVPNGQEHTVLAATSGGSLTFIAALG